MGMRGGAARRMVGNPLGGILRDVDRRSRSTTRRRGSARIAAVPEPVQQEGPARPQRAPVTAATVIRTGDDGRARWAFPVAFRGVPVLSAVPGGNRPLLAVVEEVDRAGAVVRVWAALGLPTGPGVPVHLRAVEAGSA